MKLDHRIWQTRPSNKNSISFTCFASVKTHGNIKYSGALVQRQTSLSKSFLLWKIKTKIEKKSHKVSFQLKIAFPCSKTSVVVCLYGKWSPKKELISFKLAHSSIWEFWMKCFKHYDAKKKFWVFLFQATGLNCLQSHHSGLSMYDKEKFHRQRNSDKNWLFICTVTAKI